LMIMVLSTLGSATNQVRWHNTVERQVASAA